MGYLAAMSLFETKTLFLPRNYYHIIIINIFILSSITSSTMASSSSSSIDFSTAILIKVDQSGEGDFYKIQEAIESIPPNLNHSQLYFIWVKPGIYRFERSPAYSYLATLHTLLYILSYRDKMKNILK